MKRKKAKNNKNINFPSLDTLFREYEAKRLLKHKGQKSDKLKDKCCRKYLKGQSHRCRRCPCFDLKMAF